MKNKLLFVISHQANPRFIKQINYFAENGFTVSVVYFERKYMASLNKNINKNVDMYLLGNIENGKYIKRIIIYLKSIFKLKKILNEVEPDKVLITNTDILSLLILSNIKKYTSDIIMEISDLRSYTFNKRMIDKLQRRIDALLFNRYLTKMIFTSPKFLEFYYSKIFSGESFILENKPLSNMLPPKCEKVRNDKLIIGIVGLLLDGNPHKALFEYVKDKSNIEVHIYGFGPFENQAISYSQKYRNIKYFGQYDFFNEISEIYSSLDIIYMSYDTTNNDLNINLALPNKLYEAMYFKVPIITSKDTFLGDIVEDLGIGYIIECCNNIDIDNSIKNFEKDKKNMYKSFSRLNEDRYLADNDYKRLKKFIESGNLCKN